MKYVYTILIILAILVSSGLVISSRKNNTDTFEYKTPTLVTPSGDNISIKIADTQEKRTQGLSETKELKEDQGMWFIFPEEGYYPIWMKDMNFNIDILWLSNELEIVHKEVDISPSTYRSSFDAETYVSSVPAQYVLEIPSGMSEKYELSLNSKVHLIGE